MLTTLEANFVQEYKQTGNASEAVRRSYGSRLTNPKSASVIATRLLKKPHIKELIDRASVNQMLAVTAPTVNYPNRAVSKLPSKDEYALRAWDRSSDESTLKEDTKFKYYDLAGRVLGHVGKETNNDERPVMQLIINELNINEILNGPQKTDLLDNQTNLGINQIDGQNISGNVIEASTANTPTPTPYSTAHITPNDSAVDVVPGLCDSVAENIRGVGTVGEEPRGGVSNSVNPLPKSPTILNSVNEQKVSSEDKV